MHWRNKYLVTVNDFLRELEEEILFKYLEDCPGKIRITQNLNIEEFIKYFKLAIDNPDEHKKLLTQIENLENDLSDNYNEINGLEYDIDELERQLDEKEEEIKELKNIIKKLETKII